MTGSDRLSNGSAVVEVKRGNWNHKGREEFPPLSPLPTPRDGQGGISGRGGGAPSRRGAGGFDTALGSSTRRWGRELEESGTWGKELTLRGPGGGDSLPSPRPGTARLSRCPVLPVSRSPVLPLTLH